MSTIFIALQCCQCSTMQVKQKKKSSNKWTCVICNQKQSVLKVFAQAFMAKDVRKFVQTFNMSRQLAEQNQSLESDEQLQTLGSRLESFEGDDRSVHDLKKKRTDWTEYIDLEPEEDDARNSDDVFETKFVTEVPKPLFKKPKFSNYNSLSTGFGTRKSDGTSYRPVFEKRSFSSKQLSSSEKEPTKSGGPIVDWSDCTEQTAGIFTDNNVVKHSLSKDNEEPSHAAAVFAEKELMRPQTSKDTGASKWRGYITEEDNNNNLASKAPQKLGSTGAKGATSKWNDYLTEEDDDDNADLSIRVENQNYGLGQQHDLAFHTTLNDQTADEDIHPDFQRVVNLDQWW